MNADATNLKETNSDPYLPLNPLRVHQRKSRGWFSLGRPLCIIHILGYLSSLFQFPQF